MVVSLPWYVFLPQGEVKPAAQSTRTRPFRASDLEKQRQRREAEFRFRGAEHVLRPFRLPLPEGQEVWFLLG